MLLSSILQGLGLIHTGEDAMKTPRRLERLQSRPLCARTGTVRRVLHGVAIDHVDRSVLPIIDDDPLAPLDAAMSLDNHIPRPGHGEGPPGNL